MENQNKMRAMFQSNDRKENEYVLTGTKVVKTVSFIGMCVNAFVIGLGFYYGRAPLIVVGTLTTLTCASFFCKYTKKK